MTYIDIETIICGFLIETEEQYNIFKKKLIYLKRIYVWKLLKEQKKVK